MARPPILPTIDWKKVFESGEEYETWLENGENEEHQKQMEEARKNLELTPRLMGYLENLSRPIHVVAIAEDWCGDVARHVPVFQRMADISLNITVRYIRRDQWPDVFARFLTNGGEAIPKFIFLNHEFTECGNWGPMPENCRIAIARGKACGDLKAARKKVSTLYEADPTRRDVVSEIAGLVDIAASTAP